MVGRVEEEGEEKNEAAIPAKDILKQRCSGKESSPAVLLEPSNTGEDFCIPQSYN